MSLDKKRYMANNIIHYESLKSRRIATGISPLAIFLFLMLMMVPAYAGAQLTAPQVASQASAKLKNATGIKAEFRIDVNGKSVNGSLLSAGRKYRIMSGAYSAWYDGRSLYTLNPRTKETTLVTPTASELRESNPLMFMDGASESYDLAFAAHQPAGKYMLVLTPKRKNEPIKSVFITLDKKTLLPENIVVTGSDGSVSTLSVTSLKTNMKIGAGIFIYPRDKYPAYRLNDLR